MKYRVIYSHYNTDDEETGICVMRGKVSVGTSRWFPAGLSSRLSGAEPVCMVVLCQKREEAMEAGVQMEHFLQSMKHWFETKLSDVLHHFSFEIVMCYWRKIWRECEGEKKNQFDFSAFFFFRGEYLYGGAGHLPIYECSGRLRRWRRWYTAEEHRKYADEFGEQADQKVCFKVRKSTQPSRLLLCSEAIQPENPGKNQTQEELNEFCKKQAEERSFAVIQVECIE